MLKRDMRKIVNTAAGAMILAGWAAAVLLSGCDNGGTGLVAQQDNRSTFVREDVLARAALQYYWKSPRQLSLGRAERIVRMYCLDENLYFITNHGRLLAMDAAVGNPKWAATVARKPNTIFAPAHMANMRLPEEVGSVEHVKAPPSSETFDKFDACLINTMSRLLIIDRKSGKVYRDVPFDGFAATSRGACNGEFYYVASGSRMYHALKLEPMVSTWKREIGQMVLAPLSYYNRRLYIGTMDGTFRCADLDNFGQKHWELHFDGPIRTAFHVDARGVFLACNDRRIHALNPVTGMKLWRPIPLKGDVEDPMQVGELTIFQYVRSDGLYAVNLANGNVRWKKPNARRVLALMDGVAYLLDKQNRLQLVNEITGKAVSDSDVQMRGFELYADNLSAPAIYAATRGGRVFCIRRKQAGRLTAEMLTK